MENTKKITGKVLYELLFAAVISIILILWAKFTWNIVKFPIPDPLLFGYVPLTTGVIFVCSGIWNLSGLENGFSKNDTLTKKFLGNGIYTITRYPICSGFVMICFGLSAVSRSASGFWLVSPIFTLMLVAFAAVFKNDKTLLVKVIPDNKPFLSLPSASNTLPSVSERISSCLLVFVPWLIIYETFIFIGAPKDAISTNLPFEEHLPVWEFSEVIYLSAFVFSLLVPFVIKTTKQLRCFITDVWFIIIFVGIIYMTFPLIVKQRSFVPHSSLGRFLLFERSTDGESGALPSCHVIWAFLAAEYFSKNFVRFKWIWYALAVLISASCITTGDHSVLDVAAGFGTFVIVFYRRQIWNYILYKVELLSNSRRLKKISGGAAGFTGVLLAGFFLGKQSIDFFILIGSFAMAAPWVQAIGRFRCLVCGPLNLIQLYSAGADILTGLVLISLFNIGMSSSFIAGIYLILNGIARLVEKSFREKVQMLPSGRMKIYRWTAILYILPGIIITTLPNSPVLAFKPNFLSLILAIIVGILVSIVSGIDFPGPDQGLAHQQ